MIRTIKSYDLKIRDLFKEILYYKKRIIYIHTCFTKNLDTILTELQINEYFRKNVKI